MTIYYVVTILTGVVALITPLTYIYGKLVRPIKKVMRDTEENKEKVAKMSEEIQEVKSELQTDIRNSNDFAHDNREITMRSLVAILEGLEEQGCNGSVTKTKRELIAHLTKNLKKKK